MRFTKLGLAAFVCGIASAALALARPRMAGQRLAIRDQTDGLQDIVTWDEFSLKINGSRVLIWSGEVRPIVLHPQHLS
jgi:hypothetical protein